MVLSIGECMVELSPAADGLYRRGFAGDTFNTAWYLRRLLPSEVDVAYFTNVGDDPLSQEMVSFIAGSGVSTRHIRPMAGRVAGLYLISLNGHERSFSYWRDTAAAKALADDEDRLREAVASARVVYFSGITLAILPEERRAAFLRIMAQARQNGTLVAFDPNIRDRLWQGRAACAQGIEAGAEVASICLPSFDDEARIFGDDTPQTIALRYLALGCDEVVVKDGGGDALLMLRGETQGQVVAATKVAKPVDTTGAGDSFGAGYIAARLTGRAPLEAVSHGHATAAKVIQGYGGLVDTSAIAELA
ncbi:sugar kinase [Aureimonas fodinaquatilis]|uniref:Sugar kinase n=2 Tax=Aureimonas fodinaquatilis TaxID=2565783 RepID=A0A5B0E460_9HYPH|nr:sugar kinase [Aureimonas fodinaquatilis]